MTFWSIIVALLVLALCVFLHELGHFLSAVWLGIPVEEFSIGFGPKLFQFKRKGINYSLRLIFLGGYVRYYLDEGSAMSTEQGESGDAAENAAEDAKQTRAELDAAIMADPRSYYNQPAWKRFISAFCGPFMNFVLAYVVAIALFVSIGTSYAVPKIDSFSSDDSAAAAAGLLPGDIITSLDGQALSFDADGAQLMTSIISQSAGAPLDVTALRDGDTVELTLTPAYSEADGRYMIGIYIGTETASCSLGEAFGRAASYLVDITKEMYMSLGQLFTSRQAITEQLTGPVGTVQLISQQVQLGFTNLLNILMFISLNLGILNLLPIPGLDGSKLILLIIEMIRRKPVPPSREAIVNLIGLALLLGLMIFVTLNDITRLIGG